MWFFRTLPVLPAISLSSGRPSIKYSVHTLINRERSVQTLMNPESRICYKIFEKNTSLNEHHQQFFLDLIQNNICFYISTFQIHFHVLYIFHSCLPAHCSTSCSSSQPSWTLSSTLNLEVRSTKIPLSCLFQSFLRVTLFVHTQLISVQLLHHWFFKNASLPYHSIALNTTHFKITTLFLRAFF